MNLQTYREEIEEIRKDPFVAFDAARKNFLEAMSQIMSANLYNLMPHIPSDAYENYVRDIHLHTRWAIRDENYPELIADFGTEGQVPHWESLHEKPAVFCTFHTGSYRLIVPFLVKMGLKVTLLIDGKVAEMQGNKFREVVEHTQKIYPTAPDCFRMLDVGMNNVALQLVRELKAKRCLVIFLDGNAGVEGNYNAEEKLVKIDFFRQKLWARKGVGYISYLAKAPIIPVIAHRSGEELYQNVLRFHSPISPSGEQNREVYCEQAIQALYGVLEKHLEEMPCQWESWKYVEKSLEKPTARYKECEIDWDSEKDQSVQLNLDRYGIFRAGDEEYALFDRLTYESVILSAAFHEFLISLKVKQEVRKLLEHPMVTTNTLAALYRKEIIVMED